MDRALVSIWPEMFGRRRVVQEGKRGGGGGPLVLFTDQKLTNHESGISTFISVFESHKQHVKYRFDLALRQRKKWQKNV